MGRKWNIKFISSGSYTNFLLSFFHLLWTVLFFPTNDPLIIYLCLLNFTTYPFYDFYFPSSENFFRSSTYTSADYTFTSLSYKYLGTTPTICPSLPGLGKISFFYVSLLHNQEQKAGHLQKWVIQLSIYWYSYAYDIASLERFDHLREEARKIPLSFYCQKTKEKGCQHTNGWCKSFFSSQKYYKPKNKPPKNGTAGIYLLLKDQGDFPY